MKFNKATGCLIPIFIFFIICIIIAIGMSNSDMGSVNVSKLIKVGIADKEKASQIDEILNECGITIQEIKHEEFLDNATGSNENGYRITSDGIKNIILYIRSDYTVYSIKYADKFLYNDNSVISSIKDYYLSDEEKSSLEIKSEKMIKNILKSPSTAKFPTILEWNFDKNTERILIQSYVDSQNNFGSMIRSYFQITLSSDQTSVVSFIFDGQEYIK